MVPSAITRLESLPLTANGKVDRTALEDEATREGRATEGTVVEDEAPADVAGTQVEGVIGAMEFRLAPGEIAEIDAFRLAQPVG